MNRLNGIEDVAKKRNYKMKELWSNSGEGKRGKWMKSMMEALRRKIDILSN